MAVDIVSRKDRYEFKRMPAECVVKSLQAYAQAYFDYAHSKSYGNHPRIHGAKSSRRLVMHAARSQYRLQRHGDTRSLAMIASSVKHA